MNLKERPKHRNTLI